MINERSCDIGNEKLIIPSSGRLTLGFMVKNYSNITNLQGKLKVQEEVILEFSKDLRNEWEAHSVNRNFNAEKFFRPIINQRPSRRKCKTKFTKKEMRMKLKGENEASIERLQTFGFSRKQISSFTNLPYSFVNNYHNRKLWKSHLSNYDFPKKKPKFSRLTISHLKSYLETGLNSTRSMKHIRQDFYSKHGNLFEGAENPSLSTYRRIITGKKFLNYSFRRLPTYGTLNRSDLNLKADRNKYARKIAYFMKEDYEIIYIDESSFNANFHPGYGYIVRNKRPNISFRTKKSVNYSLIAAVSSKKLYGYMIYEKSVKGFDFFQFLSLLIKEYDLVGKKYLLVFDNCRTHKKKEYWKTFRKHFNVVNTPPYSPQISLVEYFFLIIKRVVKKEFYEEPIDMVRSLIREISLFDEGLLSRLNLRVKHFLHSSIQLLEF